MKQVHPIAEYKALTAILCSPSQEVRQFFVSKLKTGHFGYEGTGPVFVVVSDIIGRTGAIPDIQTLGILPNIPSSVYQNLAGFASTNQPIATVDDATLVLGLLDDYRKTRLIAAACMVTLSELENEVADFAKVRSQIEGLIMDLNTSDDNGSTMWHYGVNDNSQALYDMTMNRERKKGIPFGFAEVDKKTNGMRKGHFGCLASHYKGGKSFMGINMASRQYQAGYNVAFLPFEMDAVETSERHYAFISGIEIDKIKNGTCTVAELRHMQRAYDKFKAVGAENGNKFSLKSMSTATPAEIVSMFKGHQYDVIYCDYMKLMRPSRETKNQNEADRLDNIYSECKRAATTLDVALVGLAQMDEKTGDMRYSRAINEHVNWLWKWEFKEAQKALGGVTEVSQVSRSWEAFPFKIKMDLAIGTISEFTDDMEATSIVKDWNKELSNDSMF